MPEDKKQPIVVKKVKKVAGSHHGGAWKVAYADFVTAMMAFFLLMWLLGSTNQSDRQGISNYFQNPAGVQGPGGASTSMIDFGGALEVPKGEGEPLQAKQSVSAEDTIADKARLDALMQELKQKIEQSPQLKDFKDQLLLDITSEGLRIQIVDKENRPMFDLGSTRLKWYTKEILQEIAGTIDQVPNHVSIAGHTDATPFVGNRPDYNNWELSADRANSARRELVYGGLDDVKVGRVVGLADSVLFDKDDPRNPINRRISIIVLNKATERAIGLDSGDPEPPAAIAAEAEPESEAAPVPGAGKEPEAELEPIVEGKVNLPPLPGAGADADEVSDTASPVQDAEPVPAAETPASPTVEPEQDSMEMSIEEFFGPPPGQ